MIQTMYASIGTYYYFLILPVFAVFYLVYMFMMTKKNNAMVQEWLSKHPDAAKVIYKSNIVSLGQTTIHSVDEQKALFFREGFKLGFYVAPGEHIIESSYTFSRPGIFYRMVTTTYGPSKQEITVDASKRYLYKFDRKAESYSFEEVTA
ncbi:MAG: hypothetical protein ACTTKH_00990 [Treponema sp.]